MFASSLSAAEGTRLANFTSEKSVFINMHRQTLPLKRAFVAQQMPERNEEEAEPDQREDADRCIRSTDADGGVWHVVLPSSFSLMSARVFGEVF